MKPLKLNMRVTRQRDGHSCGYCAMASVYRYYGLCPRRTKLRDRLGTDSQSLPFLLPFRGKIEALMDGMGLDTRGTLCPDMYAVLFADKFSVTSATGIYPDYMSALRRHLLSGHPALALADGMAHWLVVAGFDENGVLVLDSSGYCDPTGSNRLRYRLTHEEFGALACGAVFVRRGLHAYRRPVSALDFAWAYARGLEFSLRCLRRALPQWLGLRAGITARAIPLIASLRASVRRRQIRAALSA